MHFEREEEMDIRAKSPLPPPAPATGGAFVDNAARSAAVEAAPVTASVAALPADARPAASPPTAAQINQAIDNINKAMQKTSSGIEFTVDKDDKDRVIVKVVNQATREVIRQMPTEEALEIAKALDRSQGLLIRQTV